MNTFFTLALLVLAVAGLGFAQIKKVGLEKRVVLGLALGVLLGLLIKNLFFAPEVLGDALPWFDFLGRGYMKLLQMIIIPLVMIAVIVAIIKKVETRNIKKIAGGVIAVLLLTTMIAAIIGQLSVFAFGLDARQIALTTVEVDRGAALQQKAATAQDSFAYKFLDLLPANPFLDMTGARASSTLAVLIFGILIAVSIVAARKKFPNELVIIENFVEATYRVIMELVQFVISLTPYGILGIMAATIVKTDYNAILNLAYFVLASYTALITVFIIHLLILLSFRFNPLTYVRKAWSVLTFAFISRSSLSTLPLTIEAQHKKIGLSPAIADFAGTFGTTIGQNGCAGIYPAMLAAMIAPSLGINPLSISFILLVAVVAAVSSIGIAGVGGGATYASLFVLSLLGFPLALAGVLISVEPLIDMGRTALNVSGSFVAGAVTGRLTKEVDMTVYNDAQRAES